MIELTGFGKDYGDFTAVQSLDLKIEEGEMFGFIGPNGAGKSTSIRFLATLLRATRGRERSMVSAFPKNPWMSVAAWDICLTHLVFMTA